MNSEEHRMTPEEIRAGVLLTLQSIAPELADEPLAPDRALRYQVDLDSMDWLNVMVGLHQRFGVDVPEADYRRLSTLNALVAYIEQRQAPGGPTR
jgi:acyl carrier protein